ncbi:dTDP-4-dehydrorhamnose 3,5-epimerase [Mariniflexile fucanivorans]|uniref:dTDP-4-dehydrorhamnose 3,5-epimerase n=1 Tax=Mariniflexile fucanivorans TaxID=264023 RepID=A0A4R1RLQ4_9FLAO|nr:dTDP-4-dehydrorhamnose 3,5-epimerase [Mariniflexile fucanivorans]TCL66702.1 dTDP-4-dehydrorhamnose 3,5-epimerase [Mariniflexile fucanivorans]
MIFRETKLKGCFIIEPKVFSDSRGYFMESFNKETFNFGIGESVDFVQDNQSFSFRGVIRGLHYQRGNHAQAKLLRVLSGRVLDVAVDLRKGSSSFGEYVSIELTGENKKQLYIPRGFAHGFAVLSKTAEFFYKCDNYYNKESEGGILYNDNTLNINWELPLSEHLISEKDLVLPKFKEAKL